MKFSTVQEVKVKTVDTISETAAIDLAFEYEDEIFDSIIHKFGDSVELIEFIAVKKDKE